MIGCDRSWGAELLKVSLDVGTKEITRSKTKDKREKIRNSKKETFSNRGGGKQKKQH